MIISETEAQQLAQLVDRDHQVTTEHKPGLGNPHILRETPEHRWAVAQVRDWRVQRGQTTREAA